MTIVTVTDLRRVGEACLRCLKEYISIHSLRVPSSFFFMLKRAVVRCTKDLVSFCRFFSVLMLLCSLTVMLGYCGTLVAIEVREAELRLGCRGCTYRE